MSPEIDTVTSAPQLMEAIPTNCPMKISVTEAALLKENLMTTCHQFIEKSIGTRGMIAPRRFFGDTEVNSIIKSLKKNGKIEDMGKVIGGELFPGQAKVLMDLIINFIAHYRSSHLDWQLPKDQDTILKDVTNLRIASSTGRGAVGVSIRKQSTPAEMAAKKAVENKYSVSYVRHIYSGCATNGGY
jgi:hypothetical protein